MTLQKRCRMTPQSRCRFHRPLIAWAGRKHLTFTHTQNDQFEEFFTAKSKKSNKFLGILTLFPSSSSTSSTLRWTIFYSKLNAFALIAWALAAAVTLSVPAQDAPPAPLARSFVNNEFQLLSGRYIRWAEEAFNNGDYDVSIEYSALAQENAALSDAFVQKMMERTVAEKKISRASNRLAWTENSTVSIQRPDAAAADSSSDGTGGENEGTGAFDSPAAVFAAAKEALDLAQSAFDSESFGRAADHAQAALDALAWLSTASAEGAGTAGTGGERPWRIGDPGLPRYYVVRRWADTGDCFWNIASKPFVYGNPWQWRRLYDANTGKLQTAGNPDRIAPGTVLEIPARPGETRTGTYDSAY